MIRATTFLLVFLSITTTCLASGVIPGTGFLYQVESVKQGQMVFVGKVVKISQSEYQNPNGRIRPVPKIEIEPIRVLFGAPDKIQTVYGYNTFHKGKDGDWKIWSAGNAPWIVPGDLVVVVTSYLGGHKDVNTGEGFHKITTYRFVNDLEAGDTAVLFDRSTSISPSLKSVVSPSMEYNSLFEFIEKVDTPTEYTIGDIVQAIQIEHGGEK